MEGKKGFKQTTVDYINNQLVSRNRCLIYKSFPKVSFSLIHSQSTVEWSSCSLLNGINPHITEVYKCLTCNASGHVHTTEVCSHTTAISMSLLNQCLNIIRVWHPKAINKHACQQIQSFGIYHENNFWDQCIIVYQTRALNWFKEQKQNRNKQN